MRLQTFLVAAVAVVAAAPAAAQAHASRPAGVRVSGTYTVDPNANAETVCNPISQANPAVLRCTVHGFVLIYDGSLKGRGVNDFRWIVNCATGRSYTDGTETFTGSVRGIGSGTFTWGVRTTGTFDCNTGEVTSVSASQYLYDGTGALAGFYGRLRRGPDVYRGVLKS